MCVKSERNLSWAFTDQCGVLNLGGVNTQLSPVKGWILGEIMLVQFFYSKSILLWLCGRVGSNLETFPSSLGKLKIHQPCLTVRKTEQSNWNPSTACVLTVLPTHVNETAAIHWLDTAANGVFSFVLRLRISWSTRSGAGRTARSWSECTSWKVRAALGCASCSQQPLGCALSCLTELHLDGNFSKGLSAVFLYFYSVCGSLF